MSRNWDVLYRIGYPWNRQHTYNCWIKIYCWLYKINSLHYETVSQPSPSTALCYLVLNSCCAPRGLELFVESLLARAGEITKARHARTLTPAHLYVFSLSHLHFFSILLSLSFFFSLSFLLYLSLVYCHSGFFRNFCLPFSLFWIYRPICVWWFWLSESCSFITQL